MSKSAQPRRKPSERKPAARAEPEAPPAPAPLSSITRARPGRSEEGRREILLAATESFMRLGYSRASIDEIADQLGATKGRIYHYYRSKADILVDIHRHVLDLMLTEVAALADTKGSAADTIRAMAKRHSLIIMENLAMTRVALLSTTDLLVNEKQDTFYREVAESRAAYENLFVKVLERGIKSGEFRKANAQLMAKPLLGSLNWTIMWYVERNSTAGREEISNVIADYVLNGVSK